MAESWDIKLPNSRAETYEGAVEFGDGVLKLMQTVTSQDGLPYQQTWKAYSPQAWEWVERRD